MLKQKCEETDNAEFVGPVPQNEVIPVTQKSDAVVCMINPNVINNKISLNPSVIKQHLLF